MDPEAPAQWAAVAQAGLGSAAVAAEAVQLGHSLRRALLRAQSLPLSSDGPSSASASALLSQLHRLLHPPPGDEAAARGVEAVLEAVGWELFDGLVGLLVHPRSQAGDGKALTGASAAVLPAPVHGESQHLLARACAARVLRHSGSGRDLRRLAVTLAVGVANTPGALRGPGWRQALSALTLCTHALGIGGTAAAAAGTLVAATNSGAPRLAFCSACLPLALRLVPRAEQQEQQLQTEHEEATASADGDDDGDSAESIDLDTIEAPSDAEEAAAAAAEQQRVESCIHEALECSASLADYAENALLAPSADTDCDGLRWMVGQFAMRVLLGASDPAEDGSDFAVGSMMALAAETATAVASSKAGVCESGVLSLEAVAIATQARIVRLLIASCSEPPTNALGDGPGAVDLSSTGMHLQISAEPAADQVNQVILAQILPPLLGSYAPACVAHCVDRAADSGELIALLKKATEGKEGGQAQMRQWLSNALHLVDGNDDAPIRRAALIVACHRLRDPLKLGLGTPQRRFYDSMVMLADTFTSGSPQDLQVWQGVASAILSHHLDQLLPATAPRGGQSTALPGGALLDPRPNDMERGAAVLALLRALLGHSCPGRLASSVGGGLISPEQATRQLVAFERTLTACTLQAQLWLLPALLRPVAAETGLTEDGPGGTLTLGAAIVVHRLLLRACMAAVRQIKLQATEHQIVLDERVRSLHSVVSQCLAAGAQGGLGGGESGGDFDCAGRGADMMVGALSLLRMITGYERWCETQKQLGSPAAGAQQLTPEMDAGERRGTRQITMMQGGGGGSSSGVALVEDVLGPLQLRVETYLTALNRLEARMLTTDADEPATSAADRLRLGMISGSGEGEGSQREGVSQSCTTLQMLLHAIDAASDQLLQ